MELRNTAFIDPYIPTPNKPIPKYDIVENALLLN
jgi:hypothetical protein